MLLDLLKKLQEEHQGNKYLKVRFSDEGLTFICDLGQGFDGYELVLTSPKGESYQLQYIALSSVASTTFPHNIQETVPMNPHITSLQQKVQEALAKPWNPGLYGAGRPSELLIFEETGLSESDVEDTLHYFSKAFKRKLNAGAAD